jgi:hypothetical protein
MVLELALGQPSHGMHQNALSRKKHDTGPAGGGTIFPKPSRRWPGAFWTERQLTCPLLAPLTFRRKFPRTKAVVGS